MPQVEPTDVSASRPYRMRARRLAVERTREAILNAAYQLWARLPYDEVALDQIAQRAGVSRQTIHRHFGSKEELMVAVTDWRRPIEDDAFQSLDPGDVDSAVAFLVDRYETLGDAIVRFLGMEGRIDAVDHLLCTGRDAHLSEIEHSFGPRLPTEPERRERAMLALYAATDVMIWKLLRRDFGRSREETESVIRCLVEGVLRAVDGEHES